MNPHQIMIRLRFPRLRTTTTAAANVLVAEASTAGAVKVAARDALLRRGWDRASAERGAAAAMRGFHQLQAELAQAKATAPVGKGWGSPTERGNGDRLRGSAPGLYGSGDFRGTA